MELFPYQLEGLNWLIYSWYHRRNCILADEMGLGKTVQAVTFMHYLYNVHHLTGPYLVIAPLATLMHWQRTIQTWTDFNSVIYMSTKKARDIIQEYEFYYADRTGPKFDIIITSYEVIMKDISQFTVFNYNLLIVDEAHRLKNANSKLQQALAQLTSQFRILLTGTPLQNTIEELQSLLEFLHPGQFQDITTASTVNDVNALRKRLKPHLLRRLKADVDRSIAPKEETIIECSMTKAQKQFYRAVLEMNAGFLARGTNLANIAMELRKVCLHPYLIKDAEEKILAERGPSLTQADHLDCLIRASGKMILLHKLLPRLYSDGHRVLIFSQMTRLLDILQDYLAAVGYKFFRIDGSVKSTTRQQLIDGFNAEGSDTFIFLLCTRAGGLGITLNAADTVIIFDSDWNPQNDLQAQARCHRIGQRKIVKVYRLITKGTYEERMFQIASRKLGLGHAVLDKEKGKELDKLLRQGAYHMLNDLEEENFGEEDIDQILSRSTVMVFNEAAGSTFSKANFGVDEDDAVDLEDPDFWSKMLPKTDEPVDTPPDEDTHMRTRRRVQPSLIDDEVIGDDDDAKEWRRIERERLQHLLSWYGWGRWEDASHLTGLKRPVTQIKLAARAFLRWLVLNNMDVGQFTLVRQMIDEATSSDFDPGFVNADEAEAADAEFMRQSTMIDPDFVQLMQRKGGAWLKRIELLSAITLAVERAEYRFEDIIVPSVQGNLPAEWWQLHDDRCLIYGTWKYGFARYDEFMTDELLTFSCKSIENAEFPASAYLTPRLKKLAVGIRKYYFGGRKADEIATEVYRPRPNAWRKRDKSTVLQQMLHGGVYLTPEGEYDWALFRETCGFPEKTDEQMEKFVDQMMNEGGEADQEEKEEEKGGAEESGPAITAGRIKQRFVSLTRLRLLFIKYTEAELSEYFSYLPRWRNVPRGWTNQMEFFFFHEIATRGWGICGEILKMPAFDGVFDGDPPTFVTLDTRVMRRLDFILNYIETNQLDQIRQREAGRPKKKEKAPVGDLIPVPDLQLDHDGNPHYPIHLTSTAYISDLGRIVTDRTGFHTERYIYPAGFRSSRLYASTIDPTKRTRYTCEILDVGDQMPLFRVTMDENPNCTYEGNSPTSPWNLIMKEVLERRTENPRALSISGPEYYGLAAPITIYLIQKMEGADQCVNYQMRPFATAGLKKPGPPKPPVKPQAHDILPEGDRQQQPPPPMRHMMGPWGQPPRILGQTDPSLRGFFPGVQMDPAQIQAMQQAFGQKPPPR
jgi:superfamily II DNA or RNA helicase